MNVGLGGREEGGGNGEEGGNRSLKLVFSTQSQQQLIKVDGGVGRAGEGCLRT